MSSVLTAGISATRDALNKLAGDSAMLARRGIDQATVDRKRSVAARLTEVVGGGLTVQYEPGATIADDEESTGHQFTVELCGLMDEGAFLWFDDRDGDLGQQLAGRLRTLADDITRLAAAIEAPPKVCPASIVRGQQPAGKAVSA